MGDRQGKIQCGAGGRSAGHPGSSNLCPRCAIGAGSMSLLGRILEVSPYLEVAVRRIYWSSSWLVGLAQRRAAAKQSVPQGTGAASWGKIEEFLRAHGVR